MPELVYRNETINDEVWRPHSPWERYRSLPCSWNGVKPCI